MDHRPRPRRVKWQTTGFDATLSDVEGGCYAVMKALHGNVFGPPHFGAQQSIGYQGIKGSARNVCGVWDRTDTNRIIVILLDQSKHKPVVNHLEMIAKTAARRPSSPNGEPATGARHSGPSWRRVSGQTSNGHEFHVIRVVPTKVVGDVHGRRRRYDCWESPRGSCSSSPGHLHGFLATPRSVQTSAPPPSRPRPDAASGRRGCSARRSATGSARPSFWA